MEKSKIIGLLVIVTIVSAICNACSYDNDLSELNDTSDSFDVNLSDSSDERHSTELVNKAIISFKDITPTLYPDSVPFDFHNARANNIETVNLKIIRLNSGLYAVNFSYKNLNVEYRTANTATFPNEPGAINIDVYVNKDAKNTVEILHCGVRGTIPQQTLEIAVSVETNESGKTETYVTSFIAALSGNKLMIKDHSYVK